MSGLEGSGLVLTNLGDLLTVTANGPFVFDLEYADGLAYEVRVATQPTDPGQVCSVSNEAGTIDGADVTDIEVTCEALPPADEHLDATFGAGGKVTLALLSSGLFADATDVALQDDNKIVVVGQNQLARYNADGSLDTGFGAGGEVTVEFFGSGFDVLNAVAIQPDGRIAVAGYTSDGAAGPTRQDFAIARYNPDGTLDATFGTDGKVVTDFEGLTDRANDVLIQPDGAIIVAGSAQTVGPIPDNDFGVVRYTSAGALDSGFGVGGKVTTDFGGVTDLGYAAALQPDGKIVLAGRVAPGGGADPDFGIVRYNGDGSRDASFGTAGIVRNLTDGWDEAADVVVQPDGRTVVAGFANPPDGELTVDRHDPDGRNDATFGINGRISASVMTQGRGVALQPDGRIIIAGMQRVSATGTDYAIARFDTSGELDTTFGTNGRVQVDFFGGQDIANAVVIQPDGRIVVAGSASNGNATLLGLVRVLP